MVYIDGLNLHHGMLGVGYSRHLWLNLARFGDSLVPEGMPVVGVEYFTARFKKDGMGGAVRQRNQSAFIAANRNQRNLRIHESFFVVQSCECDYCFQAGKEKAATRYTEKLTDTHIASRMIGDAVRNLYDIAVLVSRDNDLAPPIREVHALFPDKQVIVASPTMKIGKILQMAANSTFVIEERVFAESQLPDTVAARRGKTLTRPLEWTE